MSWETFRERPRYGHGRAPATCTVPRCGEAHYARGFCSWHYYHQGNAEAMAGPRPPLPRCEGCGVELARANYRVCAACRPDPAGTPDRWVNTLVCVCYPTAARADRALGECPACHRKPIALMSERVVAAARRSVAS